MKRNIDQETRIKAERVIRRSIEFAFNNRTSSKNFVATHAQEMSEEVCQQHIDLYVNKYSLELGFDGEYAVNTLFKIAEENKIIPEIYQPIFCCES